MKRKTAIILFATLIIALIMIMAIAYSYFIFVENKHSFSLNETFVIANWNMQAFGLSKSGNPELMNTYADVISHFDIVFLQEIRDETEQSFWKLCHMLPDYNCNISSRAGRNSYKEQYGIIYLKRFNLNDFHNYNPDSLDRWGRPPLRTDFSLGNYSFTIYDMHTKPNETLSEMQNLEQLIDAENNSRNIIVLGDLNADCYYFNPYNSTAFNGWHWIIDDNEDTTSGSSDCAYDRIIVNDDAFSEYADHGVYRRGITPEDSDHYPVWIRMRSNEYIIDEGTDAFIRWLV